MLRYFEIGLSLLLLASVVMGCNKKPAEQTGRLVEDIDVRGICYEDHVRRPDNYAGQLSRWQDFKTATVSTFGRILNEHLLSADRMQEHLKHPTAYQTPDEIEFSDSQTDTSQPKWILHGVSINSEGEDEETGYDSTCELTVVKRNHGPFPTENPDINAD